MLALLSVFLAALAYSIRPISPFILSDTVCVHTRFAVKLSLSSSPRMIGSAGFEVPVETAWDDTSQLQCINVSYNWLTH